MTISISDPMKVPVYGDSWLHRWCEKSLYEARDEVFVRATIKTSLVFVPILTLLLVHFTWWAAAAYVAAWAYLAPIVILMLHNTMHRPFIRRPRWLGKVHPYWYTALMGIPSGYMEHHVAMHHVEENLAADLSSTMRFKRDNFFHFLIYFTRFFALIIVELPLYLLRNKRTMLARRVLIAELCHWALVAGACLIDLRGGLVGFLLPLVTVRFLMMMGNWGQHAFIDEKDPANPLLNSITCINSPYNHKAWNDGYHIGHHVKSNRHWSEMPADFLANLENYTKQKAIVFSKLDFFLVSLLLFTRQYWLLAKCFVRIDGVERSDAEVIAFLKSRVQPINSERTDTAPVAAA